MDTMFHSKYTKTLRTARFFAGNIKSLDTVKLFGVILYRNINFKRHVEKYLFRSE